MNERIRELRKHLNLTLEEFGKKVGVTKAAIGRIEKGERSVTDQMFLSICREFNVNEEWLRTGEGEMFTLQEDEEAAYVSELLEDTENPLYDLIKAIMKTYTQTGEKEKAIIKAFAKDLHKNLKEESQD
ncbi:helix-turn-helix transcriptional regulator [Lacrimispora saccharolytica]|nr:helix-turn-helix transcriptional regulator [Lacrimispora saccharolytica]